MSGTELKPELTTHTFAYSLFAVVALAAWAVTGSFVSGEPESSTWATFHRCTPVVAPLVALIAIVLLCMDFL